MKASEFLQEVFIKYDSCGKNFKTTQCLKDHCDQAHQNLPKKHKHKCDQCDYQTNNEKELKQHQKMKHKSLKYKKLVIFSSVELVRKKKILFLCYHIKHNHNKK